MKIGLAKETITPSFPILLSGFAANRVANSKYDDVYVKVVVCENENNYYGAISYDLVGFDNLLMERLQQMMKKLELNVDNFVIAATHTHSAQGGIVNSSDGILKGTEYIFMPTDLTQIQMIVDKTATTLKKALLDLKESHLYVSKDILTGIGSNRNHHQFKGNNDILSVFIEQEEGQKAVLINFACHPTVLNHNNVKVSSDFLGALDEYMCEKGYLFSMFLNGSCGDISTRFTREKSGYEEVRRYGKLLSDKVLTMRKIAKKIDTLSINVQQYTLTLALKKADSVQDAEKKLDHCRDEVKAAKVAGVSGSELRVIESYQEGATANLNYAKNAMDSVDYKIDISLYKVNDDIFVGIPGELFSQLSNSIQNEHIHFITYHKGYVGYFADEYAYDQFYYEALSSPFEKGQSEFMMEIIKEKIAQMQFTERES